jgi:basic amino acid/polyamine antiporter, APA family
MTVQKSNPANSAGLIRGLGMCGATAVVVGSMIGQGVFLVASDVGREVGSSIVVLLLWLLGGVIVLCGTLCYAELGAALPEAGGDYIYLSRGIHPVFGFLYGWTTTIIMLPGAQAVIAVGLVRLATFVAPSITTPICTWQVAIPFASQSCGFTLTWAQLVAALDISIVTLLNYFSVRTSGGFQIFLTTLKITAISILILFGFFVGRTTTVVSVLGTQAQHRQVGGMLTALVPVMLAYNGFQHIGKLAAEIVRPGKNLPRAVIFGTSLVLALYLLVNWTYFRVLGFAAVAQSQHVATDTISRLVGIQGAKWLTIAMMISAFGAGHAGFLIGPRVPYAMARDRCFFAFAKHLQPKFHSPSGALLLQWFVAILLVLSGTYQELYSYAMFATWTFFALTAVALIQLRRKEPSLTRPFHAWAYPWTPLVFGTMALMISVNLWRVRPVQSSIGLGVILLGLPFFYSWERRRSLARVPNCPREKPASRWSDSSATPSSLVLVTPEDL